MRTLPKILLLLYVVIALGSCKVENRISPVEKTDIGFFTGHWTLDITGGWVGWLEVRQEEGYLDGSLLWKWGSVEPVSQIYLAWDQYLIATRVYDVVRTRDEKGNPLRVQRVAEWLQAERDGEGIKGYMFFPRGNGIGVDSTAFTGKKLPPVPQPPNLSKLKFGEPVVLFNGKDLTGWRLINDKDKNGFSVVGGILVNDPVQVDGQPHVSYGNLRTEREFEDFNLKIEVNIPPGSNSGIYLRGMYEVQVFDSYLKPLDPLNMGAIYSRIKPSVNAEKPAGEWQSLDITLCDRHVTVVLNGVTIVDNQPVHGPTGSAIISDVFAPGPIYLQGDHGKVSYRNIILTPVVR